MFTKKIYEKRVNTLFSQVEEDIDALILSGTYNILYFTGFDGAIVTVLLREEKPIVIVPRLEYLRARDTIAYGDVIGISPYEADLSSYEKIYTGKTWELAKKILKEKGVDGKIGIDKAEFKVDSYNESLKILDSEFVDITKTVAKLRSIKSEEEVKIIRESINVAEKAMKKAIESLDKGITESEVAAEIDKVLRHNFSDRSFDPIVAFGANAAYPHAKPGHRELKNGDFVIIDLGARLAGYCSDITRTFIYGKPSEKQKKIFNIVLEAQAEAIEYVKAGIEAKEVDKKAREILKNAGLSQYFNHGLGHGVGLEVHEIPYLNPTSKDILLEGMIVTIEPGVYIDGFGGVRIEDMILVTKDGSEVLTKFEKNL